MKLRLCGCWRKREILPWIKPQLVVRTRAFERARVQLFQKAADTKYTNEHVCKNSSGQPLGKSTMPTVITNGNMCGLLFLGHEGKTANPAVCVDLLWLLDQVRKMPTFLQPFHNTQNHSWQKRHSLVLKLRKCHEISH